ncbi:MAG: hypothetical protein BGO03_07165 [Mesorhizobium sp. 61-13]|nr:hypothetical protein [Mesorhizobium sp.]OJU52074.1 MAG: hypothetical protein BGO03_07165 [Mesorhizobium sp. 61-13]
MPTSVIVTLRICVEIDDEYLASDHIDNIVEVTQRTFPVANVEMLGSDVSDGPDGEGEPI